MRSATFISVYSYFSHMNLFQIGEAKRVPGVTPAALLHIIHHIKHYAWFVLVLLVTYLSIV